METHTDKKFRYSCNVAGCGKAFRYPKDLERHHRTHDKSALIPWPCEEEGCDKVYVRRDRLLRHLRDKHPDSPAVAEILMASARRLPRLTSESRLNTPKRRPESNYGSKSPVVGPSIKVVIDGPDETVRVYNIGKKWRSLTATGYPQSQHRNQTQRSRWCRT